MKLIIPKKLFSELFVVLLISTAFTTVFWSMHSVYADFTVSITNGGLTVSVGNTATLLVTTNDPLGVTWSVDDQNCGSIDSVTGVYTPPPVVEAPILCGITATGNTAPHGADFTEINVVPHYSIQISPNPGNVYDGGLLYYSAVTDDPAGVTWVTPNRPGNIDQNGLYSATGFGSDIVGANSNTDPGQGVEVGPNIVSCEESIAVDPVILAPRNSTISAGQIIQFNSSFGSCSDLVSWSLEATDCSTNCPPDAGSIDQNGLYTSSVYNGTYEVVAHSTANSDESDPGEVIVTGGTNYVAPGSQTSGPSTPVASSTTIGANSTTTPTVATSTAPIATSTIPVIASSTTPIDKPKVNPITVPIINLGGDVLPKTLQPKVIPKTIIIHNPNPSSITSVSWGVVERGGGSLTITGLYTAPTTLGTYHIVVASDINTNLNATATVNVVKSLPKQTKNYNAFNLLGASIFGNPLIALAATSSSTPTPVAVIISPSSVDLLPGGTQQFTATVVLSASSQTQNQTLSTTNQAIKNIKSTFEKAAENTAEVVNTPEGTIVTNTVTTVGAVTGASAMSITSLLANPLFASPLSVSEIFLIPFRLWGLALSALGLRKRHRPWGTVYNSVTKMPIDPAFVTLYDSNNKQIATSITDLDGRFGFVVPKGTYHISVKKSNFTFPSVKLAGKSGDDLYQDLYFGETIQVLGDGAVIAKNIPLDPQNFDWNEFAKNKMGVMKFHRHHERLTARITSFTFWLGFLVAFVSIFLIPHIYSLSIFYLYLALIALRFLGVRPKVFGTISDHNTGAPLAFASISVFSKALNTELFKKVADQYGRYYFLVPKGEYEIKIARKNLDESYTDVYTNMVNARNGVVNGTIEV